MPHPEIAVLAGVNGAGKSSVAGAILARAGGTHFDPDAFARELEAAGVAPGVSVGQAWSAGRDGLLHAIRARQSFALETTLGGHTITLLLRQAAASGLSVRVLYVVSIRSTDISRACALESRRADTTFPRRESGSGGAGVERIS